MISGFDRCGYLLVGLGGFALLLTSALLDVCLAHLYEFCVGFVPC